MFGGASWRGGQRCGPPVLVGFTVECRGCEFLGGFGKGLLSWRNWLRRWICGGFGYGLLFRFLIVIGVVLVVVIDGGECAEEQAADVGEDGSAAWGDASFGEEIVEGAEGVVDALRPLEIERITSEHLAKVLLSSGCRVVRAELGGRVAG
jgi:hypothetical protein